MDQGAIFNYMQHQGAMDITTAVQLAVGELPFASAGLQVLFAGVVTIIDTDTGEEAQWPLANCSPEEAAQILESAAQQMRGFGAAMESVPRH